MNLNRFRLLVSSIALAAASLAFVPGTSAAEPSKASRLGLEAQGFVDRGDLGEAESLINKALDIDAKNPDANTAAARISFLRADNNRALQQLTVALAADARHAGALNLLVRVHAMTGNTEILIPKLSQLANTWRDDAGVQLAYGEALLVNKKYPEAIAGATRVLKIEETSVPAMKLLARSYLALDRPVTAESILARILESERDAETLALLAGIRHHDGKIIDARVLLEEAIQLMPGYVSGLNSLGAVYVDVRNWDSSIQVLRKASSLAPKFSAVWINLGCALRGAGSFVEAEAAWKQALLLDAKLYQPWFNLGVLYLENPLPDRDRLQQLTDAVNALNASRRLGAVSDDIDRYLEEARLLIKQEKEKRERERKTPAPETES